MRAVKSVLTAAGNLKEKFPEDDETILMLRALLDVNLAKFLSFDLPLFKNIMGDLFPGITKPIIPYTELKDACRTYIVNNNLQWNEHQISKII